MKVCITGGTGFIGQRLILRHLEIGDEVVCLTRKQGQISGAAKPFIGDLLSPISELEKFTKGVDVLYHCAAEIRDVKKMRSTNIEGTRNLIHAAQYNISRWVQLSSTGVYGRNVCGVVSENSPLSPDNPYEISKAESDRLVLSASAQYKFDAFILRPSNVYGVNMSNQSIFNLIRMVDKRLFFYIGKKKAIANYVHVDNVVDALVLCATAPACKSGTYIVSDCCDLESFIEYIAAALDKKPPLARIPESVVRVVAGGLSKFTSFPLTPSRINALTNAAEYDIQKIQKELNFKNNISIHEGITQLVQHWESRNAR